MNPSAISTTEAVDAVFFYIFGICAVMLVGITLVMIWFLVKYGRKRHPRPEPSPSHHIPLETAWTVIPTIIVMTMFWYGWEGYTTLTNVPEGAMEVKVSGRMWSWKFDYPNGRSSDRLIVPVNQAIKLEITSEDVLHSFYVPSFRIKRDAVPGMRTYAWFRAPAVGEYDAFCAEYCGVGHSAMITIVEARSRQEFDTWYSQPVSAEKPTGKDLLLKHGCTGCHSLDGSRLVGPSLQDIFGRQATVTTEGRERTITVDEEYLRRSILHPQDDLVKGYPPAMPSFEGKIPEEELDLIIDFLKGTEGKQEPAESTAIPPTDDSEKGEKNRKEPDGAEEAPSKEATAAEPSQDGERLAREKGCLACHSIDGSRLVGPSFKGLFGRQVAVAGGGKEQTLTADAAYIERSIRQPQADIVSGYPPAMPAFTDLSDEEMAALLAWLQTLD